MVRLARGLKNLKKNKSVLLLIYLVVSLVVSVTLASILLLIAMEAIFYVFFEEGFGFGYADIIKCIKAGGVGGTVGGVGCWLMYLSSERK
jgi:hypothetical protein